MPRQLPATQPAPGMPTIHVEDRQRPVNILVNTADSRPRLKSAGWFARSFSSAIGVLIAFVLVVACVCGGGLLYVRSKIGHAVDQQQARTAQAKKIALRELPHHGILALAEDTIFAEILGDPTLSGQGRDRDGKLHDVLVVWKIGKFGQTEQWELQSIRIDGDVAWKKD